MTLAISLFVMVFGVLTGPRSLSETADERGYADEVYRGAIDVKDPEILSLRPDEVDPGPGDMPEPSYNTKGDLSKLYEEGIYYYDPNPEPAPKDPELDPVNKNASPLYVLMIRCVDRFGDELRPPQVVQMRAGDKFSESVPTVSGYHAEMAEVTGIMPEHDLEYTVRYYEKPVDMPSNKE